MNHYNNPAAAETYISFLNSDNGQIQRRVLLKAILPFVGPDRDQKILDAGCGTGWLAVELVKIFPGTYGCDGSIELINHAQENFPGLKFTRADLAQTLPYEPGFFNTVILNMVGPDLDRLPEALRNLSQVTKPGGQLIMTLPNPYYAYPTAEWKRGILGALFGKKPSLKITRPYFGTDTATKREFGRELSVIASNHYPLSFYLDSAAEAGFKLADFKEITSEQDSEKFDLQYRLFRYPLLLLLGFKKAR